MKRYVLESDFDGFQVIVESDTHKEIEHNANGYNRLDMLAECARLNSEYEISQLGIDTVNQ